MKNLNYLFIALMPIFIMCTSKKEVASDEQDLKPDTTVVDTGQLDQTEQPDKSKEGIWEVVNVVDEFGDVVEGKTAILSLIDGKMSNSAVVDEKVTVKIQINIKDQTMLMSFFEYGNSPGSLPENKFLNLHIKKGDN
ncbi:MAG: hypothetical protein OEX02_18680, partial [Cyclobacteriaceae bacterium]|nr:hypothetical protein [Cyclobacteriaceae bacterium]